MHVEPQAEHRWLQKLLGEWTSEMEASMAPDKPPEKFVGSDSVRSIGDVWVMCEGRGPMPDGKTAVTMMTLGYDPARKKFVGTFIGSMMTYLWVYEGTLDASGKKLVLDAEGPSFTGDGKMAKYKDSIEFLSDDHRTLTSQLLGDDGKWTQFMEAHYRRKR
jgi:Protein of unknown function (DUF1579)